MVFHKGRELLLINLTLHLLVYPSHTTTFPEGLKNFPRQTTAAKLQLQKMQEMEQMASIQGMPTDRNVLNKLVALHPGLNNPLNNNNNHHMVGRGAPLSGSAQAALALSNYQNLLMRQNSMNSNSEQETSSFSNSNQNASSPFQGSAAILPGTMQNSNIPVSGFSNSSHLLQQRSMSSNGIQQLNHHLHSSQGGSQALQHHMIQQLLQDMNNNSNNGGGGPKQSLSGQSAANGSMSRDGLRYGGNTSSGTSPRVNGSGGSAGAVPTRSNSFKAASHSDSSAGGGNSGGHQKAPDTQQNLHLSEDLVQDIANEFTENGFFNNDDIEDTMGYEWKA